MKRTNKKIAPFFGLSYLDAILLLVAGLILSVGIYLSAEARRQEENREYCRLQVLLSYEEVLLPVSPDEGDLLFGENGEKIGAVEQVLPSEREGEFVIRCLVKKGPWQKDGAFSVETQESVKQGTILSVEEGLNKEGNPL